MAKKKAVKKSAKKIPTWKCADGRELKITEMEIPHLINTFHFIKRRSYSDYVLFQRQLVMDDDVNELSHDQFCGKIHPIYVEIRREIANRLRAMPKDSIERKFWHMKFSSDTNKIRTNIAREHGDEFVNEPEDHQ